MRTTPACVILLTAFSAAGLPAAEDDLRVLPPTVDGNEPRDMMKRKLLTDIDAARARWMEAFEALRTDEQLADRQKAHRAFFLDALGGLPERTPLNPRDTGTIRRDGFSVEKVIFESQPRHFVTAALFLPDPARHAPKHPGVLIPCGHSQNGKGNEGYQKAAALLALNGIAALIVDPVDQGERAQYLGPDGKPPFWGTTAHTMTGVGSILLGRNVARYEIWDCMRGIDYLQSRPEVEPARIGCMGNSGGGTQTSYVMALDDRVAAASPSCYICSLQGRLLRTEGPQDAEQNIFGQLAFGMDHADYLLMRAPKPTLLCAATKDFFPIADTRETFRLVKTACERAGKPECVALAETENTHGWHPPLREAAARWMIRWLRGADAPFAPEPADLKALTDAEIRCTPDGEVMRLEGARSVYDLNIDFEISLKDKRKALWAGDRAAALAAVRRLAGIRPLAGIPKPDVERAGEVTRSGVWIEKLVFRPEAGVLLPALRFFAEDRSAEVTRPVLYVHERGKSADAAPGGPIEALARSGHAVLAVDLRGMGETQQGVQKYFSPHFGPDGQDVYLAYLLGRSYVGMRTEDILACARWLAGESERPAVRLIAVGHVGVPALHAAALEPGLFESVKIARTPTSWSDAIHARVTRNQLVNAVHGALTAYDLPDLAGAIGGRLRIEEPVDPMGRAAKDR
jgi:dienelactone hydrolase